MCCIYYVLGCSHGTVESTQYFQGGGDVVTLFAKGDALQQNNTLVLFLFEFSIEMGVFY